MDLQEIDAIRINFNPDQLLFLNICLAFLMFGVALDLRVDNFRYIYKNPKGAFVGLVSQMILLPLLTLALIFLFDPYTSFALGMVLLAACPGGNTSNYAVHLSGSNAALSVLLTSITTLAAIVITPLYFRFLSTFIPGIENYQYDIYVSPSEMIVTIIQLILVPLSLGMLMNAYLPKITAKIEKPVKSLSMLIFIGFVVFSIYGNFEVIRNYIYLVFIIVLTHNSLALILGYLWSSLFKLPMSDRRAITLETGIQNSGLGLIMVFNFFDGLGGMAMIVAWWGIWHLISAFTLAMIWKNRPTDFSKA